MPLIAAFFGITIRMYSRDHLPPHFHAFYQGFEAAVAIGSGEIIAGRLPPTACRIVTEWELLRRDTLLANWERAQTFAQVERIPGPDDD
jgi:hypothetical protein